MRNIKRVMGPKKTYRVTNLKINIGKEWNEHIFLITSVNNYLIIEVLWKIFYIIKLKIRRRSYFGQFNPTQRTSNPSFK